MSAYYCSLQNKDKSCKTRLACWLSINTVERKKDILEEKKNDNWTEPDMSPPLCRMTFTNV